MPVVRYCWGCTEKFHGEPLLMLSECLECGGELLTAGDWRCRTFEDLPAGPSVGLGVIDVDPFTDEPEADKGKGKGKDAGKGKDKDAGKGKDKENGKKKGKIGGADGSGGGGGSGARGSGGGGGPYHR